MQSGWYGVRVVTVDWKRKGGIVLPPQQGEKSTSAPHAIDRAQETRSPLLVAAVDWRHSLSGAQENHWRGSSLGRTPRDGGEVFADEAQQ